MALSGTVTTDIDAPIETVWAIVQDVESAPAWQRGIDATDALTRDDEGRATCCETLTDLTFKHFKSRLSFSYFPPDRLTWEQQQGDLKSLHGSWQLEDLGGGRTRATYALHADPGALLARFLKGALEQKLRAVLIEGRAAELKARAEAASAAPA